MKHRREFKKGMALALVLCMMLSLFPLTVFADDEKPTLNLVLFGDSMTTPRKAGPYTNVVTIGASNVNGYGLRGYLKSTGYDDNTVMEAAALNSALKSGANVLGYKQAPAGSYPALLQKALSEQQGNTVELSQLAISSMRAEELRILLDNNYNGDAYSAWRFIGNGKWFDIADGVKDGDFSQLRSEYQTAVKDADLITVDIGVNNFGVYLSYMLTSNFSLDNNLELVDQQIGKLYNDAKAQVNALFAKYGISMTDYEELADTIVYALVGFCYNFDKSIECIYKLNPDATVVVVGIQNLMAGLKAEIGGIEVPFGDMIGALVNTANTYIHYVSPFAAKYLYADVAGDAGRVEFFIDKMAAYDGDPTNLDENIIDCFDVWDGSPGASYDGGFHVKYQLAKLAIKNLGATAENVAAYLNGDEGKALLNKAYDAYAQIMSTCAKFDTLDLSALTVNSKPIEAALTTAIWAAVQSAVTTTETYTLPDNFFSQVAEDCDVSESVVKTIAAMAVRTDIGNSFFGHPTPAGHVTVADKILNTLNHEKTGLDWLYENVNVENLAGKTVEEIKAWATAELIALAQKYGTEALDALNAYVLGLGVLDARQLAELETKIVAFAQAFVGAPEATVKAAASEIVDFFFEVTNLDYATVEAVVAQVKEVYMYLSTTSKEQMLADAGKVFEALVAEYGPMALNCIETYVVAQNLLTAEEVKALETQVALAIDAFTSGDEVAIKANCEKLAKLLYAFADENGYVPAEVKAAMAQALELYSVLEGKTADEIKALAVAELTKLVSEYKAEATIAVYTYIMNQGWMSDSDLIALAQEIAQAITAYKADPKGTTEAMVSELVNYLYIEAVKAGYIDPQKLEEVGKLAELIKNAVIYFETTPEEQIKAEALSTLCAVLDNEIAKYVDAEVLAQFKANLATLIGIVESVNPDTIMQTAQTYVAQVKGQLEALLYRATHGKYVPGADSYYVALGGGTVYGVGIGKYDKGYYDLLVKALELDDDTQYKNLGVENLLTTELLDYIEANKGEIAKADLITYQLDATAFLLAVLDDKTPDWSNYFTEEELAFVEQALPVIRTILEDDWTKYADLDVGAIVDTISAQVLGTIDNAVAKAFDEQTGKLDELFTVCVAQTKAVVSYLQDKAFETFFEAIVTERAVYYSALMPVVEALEADWSAYADLDTDAIVETIKGYVLTKLPEVKALTEDKVTEILTLCVEKAVELHEVAQAQIASLPEHFTAEELAFAQAAFGYVWQYVTENFSVLTAIDAEDLHNKACTAITAALETADNLDYAQYVVLGAETLKAVLSYCEDIAITAISNIQNGAEAVLMIGEKHSEFITLARQFAFEYLAEDWTKYVDMSAEWISAQIKDAVVEAMKTQYAFGKQYVEEYAAQIGDVITLCVNDAKAALAAVQAKKAEIVDVIDSIEPFKPYVDKLLYASVAYAVDTAKAVGAISAINPDATLMVIGMYNPLEGLVVETAESTIPVGEYTEYIVDATNVYYTILAATTGKFAFVAVPETTTNGFKASVNVASLDFSVLGGMLLKLNNSMYADTEGHEYIFNQIMGAFVNEPTVSNYTMEAAGKFNATVTFDTFCTTAFVECDKTCVVLAETENGEYIRLTAAKVDGEENTYAFDLTGISGEYTLVIALKGDYNLDGAVTTVDVAQANKAIVTESSPSALQSFVFDTTDDNAITTNDIAKVNKSIVTEAALEW